VQLALRQAKEAGQVTPDVIFVDGLVQYRSMTHPRAFEVQLGTHDKFSLPPGTTDQYGKKMRVRRYRNSGSSGASSAWVTGGCPVWAATWHEWGWFMANVFAMDPDARFGGATGWRYAGEADFNRKTGNLFNAQRDCDDFSYLPPREHDLRAFGRVIEDESTVMHDTYREQTGLDA
jgi:hypothetical protein